MRVNGRHAASGLAGASGTSHSSRSHPPSRSSRETPHSGYHWDGARGRFFEGWYFKVAARDMAGSPASFAFMYSIEDPDGASETSGVGAQIMGPDDGYMVQFSRNVADFWGWRHRLGLGLGNCFRKTSGSASPPPQTMLREEDFRSGVAEGFQVSSGWHQGRIIQDSCGVRGRIDPAVRECSWAYETKTVHGWGDAGGPQKATAGWLAALPVFEPHWQVLMSYGLSTGWIKWGGTTYEFKDAPSYAEKNWGQGFPKKWFWVQCNTFDGADSTALTAGGGRRTLPFSLGGDGEEEVAMIGVHHQGKFYEFVPWRGEVSWSIKPWGEWVMQANSGTLRAELKATADSPGTLLRAPTSDQGLTTVCRDTFEGRLSLRVWQGGDLVVDANSTSAALEVGGGPWWDDWHGSAEMREPLKSLLGVDVDVRQVTPPPLWPSGL